MKSAFKWSTYKYKTKTETVDIDAQTDSQQHPVGDVLGGEEVCLKHKPQTQNIRPHERGVHWSPSSVLRDIYTDIMDTVRKWQKRHLLERTAAREDSS